jgi:hypothetical protein
MNWKTQATWLTAVVIAAVVGALEFGTAGWLAERVDTMVLSAHR